MNITGTKQKKQTIFKQHLIIFLFTDVQKLQKRYYVFIIALNLVSTKRLLAIYIFYIKKYNYLFFKNKTKINNYFVRIYTKAKFPIL